MESQFLSLGVGGVGRRAWGRGAREGSRTATTGWGTQSVSLPGPFISESRKLRLARKKAGLLCLCLPGQLSIFRLVIVPAELGFTPWIEV